MTIMNHSPRSPLAIEMPLPRQLSPSCSTTSLRPPAQHSRTPSPALPDFISGTTTPAPSLLDDDDNDDDEDPDQLRIRPGEGITYLYKCVERDPATIAVD